MLQVARLAPNLLHEAADRVIEFLRGQINEDGGGKDRSGESDIYYTVFALEGLIALQVDPPFDRTRRFLRSYGDGEGLDFVHLCCLARCWAAMPNNGIEEQARNSLIEQIESYRTPDGGYNASTDAKTGSVYHSFLALGAYQDLRSTLRHPGRLVSSVLAMQTDDGGFANEKSMTIGTTPTTAAASTLLRQLEEPVPPSAANWLLARCHSEGGFVAVPGVPMPDLLSTATALHALSGMHVSFDGIKDRCLDFLDSLWTGQSFCGHWADDVQDSEYTYYALLAMGHLSL